jgi:trans-aconitate methyltransferase
VKSAVNCWNARHPDAGCGRGALVEKLADRFAHVTGVDPDAEMAEASRVAEHLLPGARVRRRLFYRYTLRWER